MIKDTGIGISRERLDKIFTPFEQSLGNYHNDENAQHAQDHKGFGLGLPLAKAMTEANNGTLAIQSQLGEGTLVELTFILYED